MADGSGKENGNNQENPAIFGRQSDISRLQSTSTGSVADVDSASKDPEIVKKKIKIAEHEKSLEAENIQQTVPVQGTDSEMHSQETISPMPSGQLHYFQGDTRKTTPEIYKADAENLNRNLGWGGGQGPSPLGGNRHPSMEVGLLAKDEVSKEPFAVLRPHHMPVDGSNHNLSGKDQTPETAGNEIENGSHMGEMIFERSADEGDEDLSEQDDLPSSPPKYTMTDKWILDHQKRRYEENKRKALDLQKAHRRISASYEKLKVTPYFSHFEILEIEKHTFEMLHMSVNYCLCFMYTRLFPKYSLFPMCCDFFNTMDISIWCTCACVMLPYSTHCKS